MVRGRIAWSRASSDGPAAAAQQDRSHAPRPSPWAGAAPPPTIQTGPRPHAAAHHQPAAGTAAARPATDQGPGKRQSDGRGAGGSSGAGTSAARTRSTAGGTPGPTPGVGAPPSPAQGGGPATRRRGGGAQRGQAPRRKGGHQRAGRGGEPPGHPRSSHPRPPAGRAASEHPGPLGRGAREKGPGLPGPAAYHKLLGGTAPLWGGGAQRAGQRRGRAACGGAPTRTRRPRRKGAESRPRPDDGQRRPGARQHRQVAAGPLGCGGWVDGWAWTREQAQAGRGWLLRCGSGAVVDLRCCHRGREGRFCPSRCCCAVRTSARA